MIDQSKMHWYSLKTVSGQEKKLKNYIESELTRENLRQYVGQVLIPLEKVVQLRKGKKVTVERNYFPGYIFIEAYLQHQKEGKYEITAYGKEVITTVTAITGVSKFLPNNDAPKPMRKEEVDRFLGKVDELNETSGVVEVPFLVGESVKVIEGPFQGFIGVIEGINEEKKKLKVIVKIFGRKTPLELNYIQVEKE
ncbi:MAG: transcription termination/antitermination factor NusG [Bacteroidetes bacterium]|jgi:transcriptional antiterminator NusG|nr:transcription termination/antitermination factor NusG [Bacteroidota bacterium]